MASEEYLLDPLGRAALVDLEAREFLSHREAKAVLERRERFELGLASRSPSKAAFLRFVAYELKLDALLAARRKRRPNNRGPGDHFASRHVAALYERALSRFGDDLDLWLEYATFQRRQDHPKAAGRVLARACRARPAEPRAWVAAAQWEHRDRGNPAGARRGGLARCLRDTRSLGAGRGAAAGRDADIPSARRGGSRAGARKLLQRGLRFNATSAALWHHYFHFELKYVDQVRRPASEISASARRRPFRLILVASDCGVALGPTRQTRARR